MRELIEEARRRSIRRTGSKPISDRETLTYADLDRRANRYARWARSKGIGKNDVVALVMPNRPDYLAIWLGVASAGGVTALINTNLKAALCSPTASRWSPPSW